MTLVINDRYHELHERLGSIIIPIGLFSIITNLGILILRMTYDSFLGFPLPLCFIGMVIGVMLIANKLWVDGNELTRCIFYIISISYVLPYEYSLLLILNQKIILVHMLAIGVFALHANIITMFWLFPTVLISFMCAVITSAILGPEIKLGSQFYLTLYSCVIVMLILTVFDYRRRQFEEEQRSFLKLLAGGIAHELTTPLASILSAMRGVDKYLPTLIKVYKSAVEEKDVKKAIPVDHLSTLSVCSESISRAGKEALMVIDMFLLKIKGTKKLTKERHDVQTIIRKALEEFPMTEEQRELIAFDANNTFEIYASGTAIKYVVNNLLKNALFQIMKARKGSITISMKEEMNFNAVYFRDSATGIDPGDLSSIFDKFFTKKECGTGLGLSFCKLAMQDVGGTITCDSELGKYTEFKLEFPKIAEDNN